MSLFNGASVNTLSLKKGYRLWLGNNFRCPKINAMQYLLYQIQVSCSKGLERRCAPPWSRRKRTIIIITWKISILKHWKGWRWIIQRIFGAMQCFLSEIFLLIWKKFYISKKLLKKDAKNALYTNYINDDYYPGLSSVKTTET